jgi:HEAT repeat protein
MAALSARIREKDWSASLQAREEGLPAAGGLAALTADRDPEIRELALLCLDEIGGPDAERCFAVALLDRHPQVRSAAMRGMLHHATSGSVQALKNAYDQSPEPLVRENVMLALGKIEGMEAGSLRRRFERETSEDVRDAARAALARLGDADARKEFSARLVASSGALRVRMLELGKYILQPWLAPALPALMDDESPAIRIGGHGFPEIPEYLRVCDVAVNLLGAIEKLSLSFDLKPNVQYTEAQRNEIRRLMEAR